MIKRTRTSCLVGTLALLGACALGDDESTTNLDDEPATASTEQSAVVNIGTIWQAGAKMVFEEITNPTGVTMSRVGRIAACDPKWLYLSEGIPLTNGGTLWQVS